MRLVWIKRVESVLSVVNTMKSNSIPIKRGGEGTPPETPQRVLCSDSLFQGARELRIAHGGETYRLTVTRQGKLILTK